MLKVLLIPDLRNWRNLHSPRVDNNLHRWNPSLKLTLILTPVLFISDLVVDPTTLRKLSMLVTYIILGFTAIAGIAIAKDDMSAL